MVCLQCKCLKVCHKIQSWRNLTYSHRGLKSWLILNVLIFDQTRRKRNLVAFVFTHEQAARSAVIPNVNCLNRSSKKFSLSRWLNTLLLPQFKQKASKNEGKKYVKIEVRAAASKMFRRPHKRTLLGKSQRLKKGPFLLSIHKLKRRSVTFLCQIQLDFSILCTGTFSNQYFLGLSDC